MEQHFYPSIIVRLLALILIVVLLLFAAKDREDEVFVGGVEIIQSPKTEPEIISTSKETNIIAKSDKAEEEVLLKEEVLASSIIEESAIAENEEVSIIRRRGEMPIVSRSGYGAILRRTELLKTVKETLYVSEEAEEEEKDLLEDATPLLVEATAYCPGTPGSGCPIRKGHPSCTGKYANGYTATGVRAKAGDGTIEDPHIIAVDPKVIPLKTLVYIEGYGYARAEDVGGAIKGERIDLLFDTHKEALQFGRQKIEVFILNNN